MPDFERITVALEPHPNADSLSIVRIGDFTVVTRTDQWKPGDEAAYIFPDALVDTEAPEFAFLRKKPTDPQWHRVRAIRLRGQRSYGLLVPWREGLEAVVQHWNPPEPEEHEQGPRQQRSQGAPGPSMPKYDLANGRREWRGEFEPGDYCIVTEKIHGANARFVWWEGELRVGSRTMWKHKPQPTLVTIEGVETVETIIPKRSWWWDVVAKMPQIEAWCKAFPGVVLYGEVYGSQVQGADFSYGTDLSFAAFDAIDSTNGYRWSDLNLIASCEAFEVPTVPYMHAGAFDADIVSELAEGRSGLHAGTQREGVVVRVGDKKLKWVSFGYLEGKG